MEPSLTNEKANAAPGTSISLASQSVPMAQEDVGQLHLRRQECDTDMERHLENLKFAIHSFIHSFG